MQPHSHDESEELILPLWAVWVFAGAAIGLVFGLGLEMWLKNRSLVQTAETLVVEAVSVVDKALSDEKTETADASAV